MSIQTEDFYNKFSLLYPLVDFFLKPQKTVLFNEINMLAEGSLLEIGIGDGAHLQHYKKHNITGIDTSATMLKMARKRSVASTRLLKMDGEMLLFDDNEFDYAVLSHVIAVADEPEQMLEEVLRVLKPGGHLFILNHFTPDNWLKYVDQTFKAISKVLHFRSLFYIEDIATIKKFTPLKEIHFGPGSYFKLLIYQKK